MTMKILHIMTDRLHKVGRKVSKAIRKIPAKWQKRILIGISAILIWTLGMRTGYNKAIDNPPPTATPEPTITVTAPEPTVDPLKADAEAVAKVLYGMRNNSDADLRGVVTVIYNRAVSPMFQATVADVCEAPDQWVGYYDTNVVTEHLYNLAYDTLSNLQNDGHHMFGSDYMWFDWTTTQITFRNTFEYTYTTKYYTVGG